MSKSHFVDPTVVYPGLVDAAENGHLIDMAGVSVLHCVTDLAIAGARTAAERLTSGLALETDERAHLAAVVAVGELAQWCKEDPEIVGAYLEAAHIEQPQDPAAEFEVLPDVDDQPVAVAYRM